MQHDCSGLNGIIKTTNFRMSNNQKIETKTMKASGIINHENSFRQTGIDNNGKQFNLTPETVQIKGTNETITVIDYARTNGDKSYFYQEETVKKKIILHFTMGYLKGDIATLTTSRLAFDWQRIIDGVNV